jgi:hypothetical protein
MWLRCGKLAFIAFIVTALTSDIGFLSVLSVLSGKTGAFAAQGLRLPRRHIKTVTPRNDRQRDP